MVILDKIDARKTNFPDSFRSIAYLSYFDNNPQRAIIVKWKDHIDIFAV
jgi:Fe-S-cluster formation regulator IscX/YfhJ